MAIEFTAQQTKVLDARNHNILVSAAAGSGKTAVLTERILRMICEGDRPLDIDRLLVVTFTNAAAAQMRDRIGRAISARLAQRPDDLHLQRQEVLIHNAKITTMDSFFTFLLRNNFAQIGLDPGFRQMDQTEADLMRRDALEDFLESAYEEGDPDFLACADYFSPGRDDRAIETILDNLYEKAVSHPDPVQWLRERALDYAADSEEELLSSPWIQYMFRRFLSDLHSIRSGYENLRALCRRPDGPFMVEDFLGEEMANVLGQGPLSRPDPGRALSMEEAEEILSMIGRLSRVSFAKYPTVSLKRYPDIDPDLKDTVKNGRDALKAQVLNLQKKYESASAPLLRAGMESLRKPVEILSRTAVSYMEYFSAVKREKGVIDFADLEHLALEILAEREEDGTYSPSAVCRAYRQYFAEILIDEYQDSNEIQELLLRLISTEDEGKYNRFMVGDVKQSIYRFRLARPEIFMEKYASYLPDDHRTQRIDLDANFRSRKEVIDSVNMVFARIMRREIGGIEYTPEIALKAEAAYPEAEGREYVTELLLADESGDDPSGDPGEDLMDGETVLPQRMNRRHKEALVVAQKIRELVGKLPVTGEDGQMRPCRYGDICVLLRSGAGWFQDFRSVFEDQGIPAYIQSKTGYFAAQEVRTVLELLRVLDNPRQDIPLYGVMRGFFGGFSDEEIARLRADSGDRDAGLYELVRRRAGLPDPGDSADDPGEGKACSCESGEGAGETAGEPDALGEKCLSFLGFIARWRRRVRYMQVHTLLDSIMEETGYGNYCRALPGGRQRTANLSFLQAQASSFDSMALQGLFDFLRYIDQMRKREVDYGEANILDENADVVRLMSIHKSKGLEFPVCFVSGLAKQHSYKGKDSKGSFLCENDWGIGAELYDSERHLRWTTFRREALADKISMDSLGEELRVLYVAMTRAKEKLILTACLKDADKKTGEWDRSIRIFSGELTGEADDAPGYGKIPEHLIAGSESFLNLIRYAMACGGKEAETIAAAGADYRSLLIGQLSEQEGIALRKERLMAAGEKGGAPLPDPDMERDLERMLSRRYAAENLKGLYTKTSVSELKMAAMKEEGEPAAELFAQAVLTPVIPSFAPEKPEKGMSGTDYGTAVHRILELFDYQKFDSPRELTAPQLREWLAELSMEGQIPASYAEELDPGGVMRFLKSPLAGRMAAADRRGQLYREQPFVLGVEARRLGASFPDGEWVLIQGIIDAFFEEEGELILVDYKTDRVEDGDALVRRYRTQMDYYTEALTQITGRKVRERILFSTSLGAQVRI